MANDKNSFQRAVKDRNELLELRAFSNPISTGRTAIICSFASGDVCHEDGALYMLQEEADILALEALAIEEREKIAGRGVYHVLDAKAGDLKQALLDETVSSICTIGHGTLTSIGFPDAINYSYNWLELALEATHLKTVFLNKDNAE